MNNEPNYLKYPDIIKEPKNISLGGENIILYEFNFRSITKLSEFLKSDPPINEGFNKRRLSSVINPTKFAGIPYNEAVEKLDNSEDSGYRYYLNINGSIQKFASPNSTYKTVKTLAGVPDPIAIATNSPYTSTTRRKVPQAKKILLHVDVGASGETSPDQFLNRAVIVTFLINSLEKLNYDVVVNSFMLGQYENEVIKATFNIKESSKLADYKSLYKTLVGKEFFRRICFRLIEVSDVKKPWQSSYGKPCSKENCMEIMKIRQNELLFRDPTAMGIKGEDIEDDFENAIRQLGLERQLNIYNERKKLRACIEDYKCVEDYKNKTFQK